MGVVTDINLHTWLANNPPVSNGLSTHTLHPHGIIRHIEVKLGEELPPFPARISDINGKGSSEQSPSNNKSTIVHIHAHKRIYENDFTQTSQLSEEEKHKSSVVKINMKQLMI